MRSLVSLMLLWGAVTAPVVSAAQTTETSVLRADVTPKAKKISGEWRFALAGVSVEEGKDSGAAAALYLSSNFNYRFTDWLNARISPAMNLFSSRMQERYDDDTFQGRVWLFDGHLIASPSPYFELKGGALNQRYHHTSMLVSGLRAFPGFQEIAKWDQNKSFTAALILQQAIPTSHTLNTEREREENLPTFNTETLSFSGENFGWLKWRANAGHFRWANIPAKVVFESRRIGNVGFGENVPNNRFQYAHEGWYSSSELCYCSDSAVNFAVEYERIHNTEAPGDAADAQLWGLGPNFNFGEHELDLRYRRYFVESDATVAYYNKSRYGNTNRIGHHLEATLKFKKEDFSIFAETYFAEPINRDPNQRDLTIFFIGVETEYAKF